MEVELVSVEELVVLPLILNVLPDRLFIDADGGDEVSSAPEALLGECALFGEHVVGSDGTLPLEKSHDIGHGVFGRNAQHHVHVIGTGIALEDFDVLLFREFSNNLTDGNPDWTEEDSFSVLWYNDHVVLAIPDHVIL